MRVEEMALRSEIRQMLNEAGFNRNTIKSMVKESINDIVKNQVNQVLMERREQDLLKKMNNGNLTESVQSAAGWIIVKSLAQYLSVEQMQKLSKL